MMGGMSRWTPDARGRLEQAAYELFLDRGYEQTTVADIAARAGLTERTFFRHYADKREVLFGGSAALQAKMVRALDESPRDASPIDAVRVAVEAAATVLRGRRTHARERQQIIGAHADLQERGLIKRATLTAALSHALRQRGIAEPAASLAADMGMVVFHVGFEQWLADPSGREFTDIVRDAFDQLKAVAAGTS
jgi:AcrR family transcriptional regulator